MYGTPTWADAPNLMTYQGRLKESDAPVTGNRTVRISLCDSLTSGNCYFAPEGAQSTAITNGLFKSTFTLPTDSAFNVNGGSWFLQIDVNGTGLAPREKLTSTPYALVASSATMLTGNVDSAAISNSSVTKQGNSFNAASKLVLLDSSARYPALDGSLITGITSSLASGSTSYIQNRNTLQSGTTFYVSSGTVQNLTATSINGTSITGNVASSAIDSSSVTKQGNAFNAASQLVLLDSSARYPALDGSLITNVTSSLSAGSTNYVQNTNSLQSNTTFYVSSGSVQGNLSVSGNLGIGNSNPASKLDVSGLVTASSATFQTTGSASGNAGLRVSSSAYLATSGGMVGIGTTNPNATLNVVGTSSMTANAASTAFAFSNTGSGQIASFDGNGIVNIGNLGGGSKLSVNGDVLASSANFYTTGSNNIGLSVSSTVYLATSGGLVGIGTMQPSKTLTVVGTSSMSANTTSTAFAFNNNGLGTIASFTGNGIVGISSTVYLASNGGLVGIGTGSPSKMLDVQGEVQINFPITGGTIIGVCKSLADGTAADQNLVECSTTPSDIVVWYEMEEKIEPGDVVATTEKIFSFEEETFDPRTGLPTQEKKYRKIAVLAKASRAYDPTIIGVISESPYQVMGEAVLKSKAKNSQPLALSGRVPVKISLENGPIKPGDFLTSASQAGYAMKATKSGRVIGIALEPFGLEGDRKNKDGKAMVFINSHYWVNPEEHLEQAKKMKKLEDSLEDTKAKLQILEDRIDSKKARANTGKETLTR